MPMPAESAEEKEKFWQTLTAEIPAFLHWLINDFTIEESWRDTRFGIKTFQHPTLMTELEELSPASRGVQSSVGARDFQNSRNAIFEEL
jgi:hypothetical protein